MSLGSERKDAIIDNMEVQARHEDGDTRLLSWTGLRENYSEITDSNGNRQVVEKESPAIAIRISTALLVEKFVRFQQLEYHEAHRGVFGALIEHVNYLKARGADYATEAMASRQLHDLLEFYKTWFWWRPGGYVISFRIESRNRATMSERRYSFTLTQDDADGLRKNLDYFRTNLEDFLRSEQADHKPTPLAWNFRTVPLIDN